MPVPTLGAPQGRPAEVEAVLRGLLRSMRLTQSEKAPNVEMVMDALGMMRHMADVDYDENPPNFVRTRA